VRRRRPDGFLPDSRPASVRRGFDVEGGSRGPSTSPGPRSRRQESHGSDGPAGSSPGPRSGLAPAWGESGRNQGRPGAGTRESSNRSRPPRLAARSMRSRCNASVSSRGAASAGSERRSWQRRHAPAHPSRTTNCPCPVPGMAGPPERHRSTRAEAKVTAGRRGAREPVGIARLTGEPSPSRRGARERAHSNVREQRRVTRDRSLHGRAQARAGPSTRASGLRRP